MEIASDLRWLCADIFAWIPIAITVVLPLANVARRRPAVIVGAMVKLLASGSAIAQDSGAGKVLTGKSAFGTWREDAPGVRRLITLQDLPPVEEEKPNLPEVVPMPSGVRPQVPKGFSAVMVASGLAQARVIRVAPKGDHFEQTARQTRSALIGCPLEVRSRQSARFLRRDSASPMG